MANLTEEEWRQRGLIKDAEGFYRIIKPEIKKEPEVKPHKYSAQKKVVDGVSYDSNREYYFKQLLDANGIEYKMKVEYILQAPFEYCGQRIRAIKIIPDYSIYKGEELIAIVDVKGFFTEGAKVKFKMLKRHLKEDLKKEVWIHFPDNKQKCHSVIDLLIQQLNGPL